MAGDAFMKTPTGSLKWSSLALAVLVPLWLLLIVPDASAQRSRGSGGGGGSAGGTASGGGGSSGGGRSSGGVAVPRGSTSGSSGSSGGSSAQGSSGRDRGGRSGVGVAVPRTQPLYGGRGGTRPHRVFVPWGFGGLGLYSGYYGAYYGGYYDPWFDPWYGGYGYYNTPPQGFAYGADASLRLKVTPNDAEVYVDGYYVGIVDDFDGIFQRLRVDAGPHRIDIRAPGHETLSFEVQLEPDQTITYRGDMKKGLE